MRSKRGPRFRACALALALPFVAAACGGSDAGTTGGSSAVPQSSAMAAIDPCALVVSDEASTALGATVGPAERPPATNIPPRLAMCRYVAPKGQAVAVMTVMVNQAGTESEARVAFRLVREQIPGATTVPDLGDEAFALGNQLNVRRGRVYLNITGDFDLQTAERLARTALGRLP